MCGIIGVVVSPKGTTNKNKTFRKIRGIFENQKNRGVDGAGFVSTNIKGWRGTVGLRYRTEDAKKMFKNKAKIMKLLKPNNKILFHHRFPTSNENKDFNNHPIMNENKTISIVHNGVINNNFTIAEELENKGHIFETGSKKELSNDSEVLVHLLEEGLKGTNKTNKDVVKAVNEINKKAGGTIALAFVIKGIDAIYLWKRDNPLKVYTDKLKNVYFSSEKPRAQGYKELINFETNDILKLTNKQVKKIGETKTEERYFWGGNERFYGGKGYADNNCKFNHENYNNSYNYTEDEEGFLSLEDKRPSNQRRNRPLLDDNYFWQYIKEKKLTAQTSNRIWNLVADVLGLDTEYDHAVAITEDMEFFVEECFIDAEKIYNSMKNSNKHLMKNLAKSQQKIIDLKKELEGRDLWMGWLVSEVERITKSNLTKKLKEEELLDLVKSTQTINSNKKQKPESSQTLLDVLEATEEEEGDCLTKEQRKFVEREENYLRAEMSEEHRHTEDYESIRNMFG